MSELRLADSVRQATDAALLVFAGVGDGSGPDAPLPGTLAATLALVYGDWAQLAAGDAERRRCRKPCPVAQANLDAVASAVATDAQRIIAGLVAAYSFALAVLAETKGVSIRAAAAEVVARSREET